MQGPVATTAGKLGRPPHSLERSMDSSTQDADMRGVFAAMIFLGFSITLTLMYGLKLPG